MLLRSSRFGQNSAPFELKGSLFTLTVLHLFRLDRPAIERHLAEKVKQAPGFFDNTPVIIDLEGLSSPPQDQDRVVVGFPFDFNALYQMLRDYGMAPMGVRNGPEELRKAASQAGLPLLSDTRPPNGSRRSEPAVRSRIVDHPVRSGQQVHALNSDLIVLGTVSAGAEVLAGGNIHIYGALRGRALAGANGDTQAWIFCQSLEAELLSIAGSYLLSDSMAEQLVEHRGKPVQIHLEGDRPVIEPQRR